MADLQHAIYDPKDQLDYQWRSIRPLRRWLNSLTDETCQQQIPWTKKMEYDCAIYSRLEASTKAAEKRYKDHKDQIEQDPAPDYYGLACNALDWGWEAFEYAMIIVLFVNGLTDFRLSPGWPRLA